MVDMDEANTLQIWTTFSRLLVLETFDGFRMAADGAKGVEWDDRNWERRGAKPVGRISVLFRYYSHVCRETKVFYGAAGFGNPFLEHRGRLGEGGGGGGPRFGSIETHDGRWVLSKGSVNSGRKSMAPVALDSIRLFKSGTSLKGGGARMGERGEISMATSITTYDETSKQTDRDRQAGEAGV